MIPRPNYDEYETKAAAWAVWLAGALVLTSGVLILFAIRWELYNTVSALATAWVDAYTTGPLNDRLVNVAMTLFFVALPLAFYGISRWIEPRDRECDEVEG